MKLFPVVCVVTALALGQAAKTTTTTQTSTAKSTAARTIEFVTGDNMKFDKTEITARPGETLRIVVKNTGSMPKLAMAHNFVLLKPGTDQVEFNTAAFSARETDFIPASMKAAVIANTPLAGAGETVETTFKAPAAGTYNFLCSFPGHFALGMRGTLTVK